jgi:hypothetical protein
MEGRTDNFTPWDNFTLGGKIYPWGTTSPLGSKFAPRVRVKNEPQVPTFALTSAARSSGGAPLRPLVLQRLHRGLEGNRKPAGIDSTKLFGRINFHPKMLDAFSPKKNTSKVLRVFRIIILDF